MLYDGHWFLDANDSPLEQILIHFEEYKTNLLRLKKNSDRVRFVIPRNHPFFKRELSIAAKYLKAADFDLDLVKRTIDVLFTDPDYSWRTWGDTLATMWEPFVTAMSVARAQREEELENERIQREAIEQIMSREDLFE